MKYIVLLNGGQGRPLFLVGDDDEAMLYDTAKQAKKAAENNCLAEARGYKIVKWEYYEGN